MAGAGDHPDIRFVVDPVHMDGTLTGAKPRMRHRPDCRHFKWPGGKVLGTPVPATEAQMRSLRPCKSCIASRGSVGDALQRSEEHTSELQSHLNLVCRLLL